jgi:uncharacterized protein
MIFSAKFLAVALLSFAATKGQAITVPPLTAPVVDQAQMLDRQTTATLNKALANLRNTAQTQVAVLTIPSLEGQTIEQVSIRVVDQWKLGDAARDDGVLLLIAAKERELRIEVGQGMEGQLTDIYANRIIEDTMVPLFKRGRIDDGVVAGVQQIVAYTNPDFQLLSGSDYRPVQKQRSSRGGPSLFTILLVLFVLFMKFFANIILPSSRSRHWSGRGRGGHWGGSSRGGFGGGFGGGGGGFSGGGASGRW